LRSVSTDAFPGSSLLIDGEIPRGIYLLTGPSGAGKTVFCKNFVAKGLSNHEPGIYLSTDDDCTEIQASIQKLAEGREGINCDLRIVDAYSWRFQNAKGDGPYIAVNPANLTSVMIVCQKVCQGLSKPRFVLDSITNLAIQSSQETTLNFLQMVTAKMRSLDALAFFTLIPMSHDTKFVSTVKTMFDGVFEMRLDEIGVELTRMFRVFSIKGVNHQTRWVTFSLSEKGMSIIQENTPRCAWCGGVIPYECHKEIINGRSYTFHATACSDCFKKRMVMEKS
jgi:KaiC/GvpD/RAD55 family RecA-like ATPase